MHWSWFTLRPHRMVRVWPSREKKAFPSGSFLTMSEKMRPFMTHSPLSSTMAGSRHSFCSVRSEHLRSRPFSLATSWTPSSTGMVERTGRALETDRTPSFKILEFTLNLIFSTSLFNRVTRPYGFLNPSDPDFTRC